MRQILFRGKREDNGEWVEGFYGQFHNRPLINKPNIHQIFVLFTEKEEKENEGHFFSAIGGLWHTIKPETLGQYTGLTAYWYEFENEPQEADVWEHDLLEVTYEGKKVIAKVEFEAGMFILSSNEFADSYIPLFDVVIIEDDYYINAKKIGNIHDNPELLKGE